MPDELSTGSSEITALAQRVATARGKLPLQHDAALLDVLSDAEIAAERELAEWVRAQRRTQRRRTVEDELAAEQRDRQTTAAIRRADDADARWHRRALAARRRVANQDARLAQLYRRAEWSSRALIAVVVLGMVWAGVNVQHNLVPSGDMTDPLYWLSYGIEAMISIPIITIMVVATTAARWGREVPRGKVVFFEAALLGTTVALNAGPHLAAGSLGQAAEYAIAPVMVGVVIWLHAWVSSRYAQLIDSAPVVDSDAVRHVSIERFISPDRVGSTEALDDTAIHRSLLVGVPTHEMAGVEPAHATEPRAASAAALGNTAGHRSLAASAPIRRAAQAEHAPAEPGRTSGPAKPASTAAPATAAAHTEPQRPAEPVRHESRNGHLRTVTPVARVEHMETGARPARHAARSTNGHAVAALPATDPDQEPDPADSFRSAEGAIEMNVKSHGPNTESIRKATTAIADTVAQAISGSANRNFPAGSRNSLPHNHVERITDAELEQMVSDEPADRRAEHDDSLAEDLGFMAESDDLGVWALARAISARGLSKLPVEQLAEILTLTDQSWTPTSIGTEVGLPRTAISQVLESARKVRHPYAISG